MLPGAWRMVYRRSEPLQGVVNRETQLVLDNLFGFYLDWVNMARKPQNRGRKWNQWIGLGKSKWSQA